MSIETFSLQLPHGIALSCRACGPADAPRIVLLHGFPEAAFIWDEVMLSLGDRYRCIAPNLRGFEDSSHPAEVEAYRAKHLVADIAALIALTGDGPLAALVAHDWGGAVAWNLAVQRPELMRRLVIVNSPHPGTFLHALKHDRAQQEASAYMNFLVRPDAERLLAEDDYRRLWGFFTACNTAGWLTAPVKQQYRAVWDGPAGGPPGAGLTGGCNYYRASPLRPPRPGDPAAAAVTLPREMLTVSVPTLVLWATQDVALPAQLVDGLDQYVGDLELHRVEGATHWIVHEQPMLVAGKLAAVLRRTA